MKHWPHKLKARWGAKNGWHLVLIMAIFALTGTTFLYVKRPVFRFVGITEDSPTPIKVLAVIFLGIPLYQVMLLAWGAVLGQFRIFWTIEKRMFMRLAGRRHPPAPDPPASTP